MDTASEVAARAEQKKTLLARVRNIPNFKYDKRWSLETLAEEVEMALVTQAEDAAQAIRDSSDTWIYLLKGAWPTADEKRFAGEVIQVPEEMANRWTVAGACRPAMKSEIEKAEAK